MDSSFGSRAALVALSCASLLLLVACGGGGGPGPAPGGGGGGGGGDVPPVPPPTPGTLPSIVFVSRGIPAEGSDYWRTGTNALPGVGPHARFRPAAPGRLLVREPDGTIRTLVDGGLPTAATGHLIDVNAPDVSWDGTTIVFAGLPEGTYADAPATNPGAWRLYTIRADGTGFAQVTRTDQAFTQAALRAQFAPPAGQFPEAADRFFHEGYDDTDPAWLPDGRIVFASTRWYAIGHYSGVRVTNLHVVGADGRGLHRITSERNGADRPLVDPLTGRIVFSRWWRNHRFPTDSLATVLDANAARPPEYLAKDGLTTSRSDHVPGPDVMFRNAWQASFADPDGSGLAMFTGSFRDEANDHVYGGAFAPDGTLYANYFPMANMTEASGFGGVRRYVRGATPYAPVAGTTDIDLDYANPSPPSFGVGKGPFAAEPAVLPDGRLVLSWASDPHQDYGLVVVDADGSNRTSLYDVAGRSELRARVLAPRTRPRVIPDATAVVPSLLPPTAAGPYDAGGTFTFRALNVYANGPVDADVVNAIPVGSAASIRFFVDHQRSSPGSFPGLDWPILLGEAAVAGDGSIASQSAPADVPLFEQLRSSLVSGYRVPVAGEGAAHVAGLNYGRPGAVARCVGCHAGHTMIPVPATDEAARWSNLAPGAAVTATTSRDVAQDRGVVDRRVRRGPIWRTWTSAPDATTGQAVTLTFPVPVRVRTVVLHDVRPGDEASSSLHVTAATVRLFADATATQAVGVASAGPLSVDGVDVAFADVLARVVRVEIDGSTGTFYGVRLVGLSEIEVVARGE